MGEEYHTIPLDGMDRVADSKQGKTDISGQTWRASFPGRDGLLQSLFLFIASWKAETAKAFHTALQCSRQVRKFLETTREGQCSGKCSLVRYILPWNLQCSHGHRMLSWAKDQVIRLAMKVLVFEAWLALKSGHFLYQVPRAVRGILSSELLCSLPMLKCIRC